MSALGFREWHLWYGMLVPGVLLRSVQTWLREARWPEQKPSASYLHLVTLRPPHVCVPHREVENTISVDRPVVSGLALTCDRTREQTGDGGVAAGHRSLGRAESLLCVIATSVWHGLKSWDLCPGAI